MNKLEEKFKKATAHVLLNNAEKSQMRDALSHVMGTNPFQNTPSPSPYQPFWHTWVRAPRLVGTFAALLCIVSAASGTVFAANGSLPGDLLYPVKIGVTEQFETAVATSPQAKVAVNTALALRRVQEAKILSARGDLTATTTAELKENFDAHAALALASAAAIATTTVSAAPAATSSVSATIPDSTTVGLATSTSITPPAPSVATSTPAVNTKLRAFTAVTSTSIASTTLATTSVRNSAALAPVASSSPVAALRAVLEAQAQTLDELSKKETGSGK